MAEFRINISNLSEGIHNYLFEAEPSKIGLDERFSGQLRAEVKLEKSSRQVFLHAIVYTNAIFICDRCLEKFDKQLEATFSIMYVTDGRSTVGVKKEEEIQVLSADTNYVDLDEDVRQFVLLAVPQKLLCVEKCQGLCPICGVNRNNETCTCNTQVSESRWDVLKKFIHN
jgi:uncharacterized protein